MRVKLNRILVCAAALLALLLPAQRVCAQQDIIVRFLNYKSGKPIRKISVEIRLWGGQYPRTVYGQPIKSSDVYVKTDENGQIVVHVPEPIPEYIYLASAFIGYDSRGWATAPSATPPWIDPISVPETLKSGLVVPYGKGHSRLKISPKPGEITVLNRKLPWWDLIYLPIV